MAAISIQLKPYQKDGRVTSMDVTYLCHALKRKAGEELGRMQLSTVTIPGCEPQSLSVSDQKGEVGLVSKETTPYPYVLRHWSVERVLEGTVTISYRVYPRVLKPEDICGPYFDFREEEGGANSAGISFLMDIENVKGDVELSWDLSEMEENSRAICTYGEGSVTNQSLEALRYAYYIMGQVHSIEEGDFGFYWLSNPPFDAEAVADYTRKLYKEMQVFFADKETIYRIFVRKDPFLTSGGTALPRSYLFGWNTTQANTLKDRQFILAHEMVHNWPHLKDEPYGVTTWYSEGTAELYSVLIPLRLGLISLEEARQEIEKRTDTYYANPTRNLGNEEAAAICWKDRRAQRLAYGRGMIFLMNVDVQMRKATNNEKSIDDVVQELLTRDPATLGNELFLSLVKEYSGLDLTEQWKQMHQGEPIAPLSGALDGALQAEEKEIEEADTGRKVIAYHWIADQKG